MSISEILISWYHLHKRDLPWRNSESAYHIWLAEIIFQQTRINQGIDYYNRFVSNYPRINDLAAASLDEVLKLWQGLGYYTRARNMHITAQTIVNEYGGTFPRKSSELLKLKGIGPYTAAAIASIAFNEPVALLDGNVYRLISRLFAISEPVDSAAGKSQFEKTAGRLLDRTNPGIHNQALMEFGALVCLPRNPHCSDCVLAGICRANIRGIVESLPVKKGKIRNRDRYFNYLFIHYKGLIYLHKRNESDIWNSLYEFPLIETERPVNQDELIKMPLFAKLFGKKPYSLFNFPKSYKHRLTHQTIYCCFHRIETEVAPRTTDTGYFASDYERVHEYAVPRIIERFLEDLKREGRP